MSWRMQRTAPPRPYRWLPLLVGLALPACGKSTPAAGGDANAAAASAPSGDPRELLTMRAAASPQLRLGASAAPSASESAAPAPIDPKAALVGTWKFSGFDMSDPGTKSFWSTMPPATQTELLTEASKATLMITPTELVTRVAGDQLRVPYTVEAAAAGAPGDQLVLKTKDGRKGVRFTDAKQGVVRVVEIDSPKAPVAFFARMPPGAAPITSTTPPVAGAASASASASAGKK
jgi:hypothetical protein